MGICLVATTLSDDKIHSLLAEPPLIWRAIEPDATDLYLDAIGQAKPPGWLARLFGDKRPWPPKIPDFSFVEGERIELDMDKSWDGANFCLRKLLHNGECPNFFEDGKPIGDVEVGYGPAMCFDSRLTARIARAYCAVTRDDLLAQYAPEEMGDVYPSKLWDDDKETLSYLEDYFLELQNFLRQAEQHHMGVVVYYT